MSTPSGTSALSLTTSSTARSSSSSSSSSTSSSSSSSTSTSATSTSSSSSSTTSTSTTTSAESSSTSSTTTSSPTTSATAQIITTTSGGEVQTITQFVVPSSNPSTTTQNHSSSSNSFFSNKGAVAGVFSVVGVVILALIVALVVNAVRRRRAERFDRDVAEAAAEAAAARSPFDDYSYPNTTGGKTSGGGGYGYSENSHGTFHLPPLQPHDGAYGMSEMSQYDPYTAGAASLAAAASSAGRSRSRKDSEPGTPGIAGVGAGVLAREPSKRAPYHAFAGPGPQSPPPQPHELQGRSSTIRGTNQDILEAVGLGAPDASSNMGNNNFNNGTGGAFVSRKPSEATQNTHLSGRSQFGSMSSSNHPMLLQPGYPVDSYYPQRNDNQTPDPFATYPPAASISKHLPSPHAQEPALHSPPLPDPQSDHHGDFPDEEPRMSYQDDTDYSQGNRILRVTNE